VNPTAPPPKTPYLLLERRNPGVAVHASGFVLVMLAAELGRMFWVGATEAALVWPPAGLALALAMAFGIRILATLAAGLLVWAAVIRGLPVDMWILPALALMLGPFAALVVLERWRRAAERAGPIGELLAFWGTGLVVGVVLSSLVGALNMKLHGLFPEQGFPALWPAYWTSEAFGTLIFAPLTLRVVAAARRPNDALARALGRGQALWLAALAVLTLAQVALAHFGSPPFAEALSYFYFPLLAVCAGMGSALFTDAMIALVGTGIVTLTLFGGAGLGPPESNFELVDTILLVTAVTITTQLLSAMAELLRRHLEAEREAARRDFLTGLGNERALAQAVASRSAADGVLALIDVPAIRRALDLLGLAWADRLEHQIADILRRHSSGADPIARIGRGLYGLLWSRHHAATAERSIQMCYGALDGVRFHEGDVPLTLRPAMAALSIDSTASSTADDLLAMASQVLQRTSDAQGQRVLWERADPALLEWAREDHDQAERLRVAVTDPTGFTLLAQPIVALQHAPGEPPFHELLLRLPHHQGGLVAPAGFLSLAARHGLMPQIDRWVINRGLELCGRHGQRVSINLSGTSLADEDLVDWIEQRRGVHGAQASAICFEITETESIQGFEPAARIVTRLRERGYRVALDDFGTGLASFEYLRNLPVDFVKIDGSFVRAAMSSATDRAMVEAIHAVASTAGLLTIAEFVEDEATRAWLTELGVDYGQGFGISRPLTIDAAFA